MRACPSQPPQRWVQHHGANRPGALGAPPLVARWPEAPASPGDWETQTAETAARNTRPGLFLSLLEAEIIVYSQVRKRTEPHSTRFSSNTCFQIFRSSFLLNQPWPLQPPCLCMQTLPPSNSPAYPTSGAKEQRACGPARPGLSQSRSSSGTGQGREHFRLLALHFVRSHFVYFASISVKLKFLDLLYRSS